MGYRRAEEILPAEIIELIQQYVDGQSIYIPKRKGNRKDWGEGTNIRQELSQRIRQINAEYRGGKSVRVLAEEFYLSEKSIQRIIRNMKGLVGRAGTWCIGSSFDMSGDFSLRRKWFLFQKRLRWRAFDKHDKM